MGRVGVHLLLLLLHFSLPPVANALGLRRCTGPRPGKFTAGCGFTCNRSLGEWSEDKDCSGYSHGVPPGAVSDAVLSATRTVLGNQCMFPFTYKGKSFTRCTIFDSENRKPWCQTEEGKLEDCEDGEDTLTVSGKICRFPFTYKGRNFDTCTTFDSANGKAWCQNEEEDLEDCY